MRAVFTVILLASQSVSNPPVFEVASVKPSLRELGKDAGSRVTFGAVGISGRNVTLKHLIVQAYRLQPYQVFGGPNWLDGNEYDIDARAGGPATRERLMSMLRRLLADRFRLSTHSETRELRIYELVTGKNGPKIHPLKDTETPQGRFRGDLQQFANFLSVQLTIPVLDDPGKPGVASAAPVPVLDKTGLPGVYDINVDMKPETGVDMFTLWQRALQDQLGLKLETRKDKVPVLVVDHVERIPVAN